MSGTKKYEMMILLREEFNDSDLKVWAFNYAKALQNLSAAQISVISRGKRNLAYYALREPTVLLCNNNTKVVPLSSKDI